MSKMYKAKKTYYTAKKANRIVHKVEQGKVKLALLAMITPLTLSACTFLSKNVFNEENVTRLADAVDKTKNLTSDVGNIVKTTKELGIEKATIVRVVDGDTIVVKINGEEATVRMIGIDTPESVAPQEYLDKTGKTNSEVGNYASEVTKGILENYNYVYLQKDTSETDKYDRLLRYVWLEVPNNDMDYTEVTGKMLNAILIQEGTAVPVVYEPDIKHAADFQALYDQMGM